MGTWVSTLYSAGGHMRNITSYKYWALALSTISGLSLAQNPFAPDFILEPFQIESFSQISYLNSTYDIKSNIFSNKDYSRFINYNQAFSIGLSDGYSVGISEVYADPLHKNPLNPSEGKSGFKSPFISINKITKYSDDLTLKFTGIIQPNLTGSSEKFNTYQLSATAISKIKSDFSLGAGLTKIRYELAHTDANTINLIFLKQFNTNTLLNLTYGLTFWDSTQTISGNFDSSLARTISAELSTNITKDIWIGLNLSRYSNEAKFTGAPFPVGYLNKTSTFTGGMTIKKLF